MKIYTRTGDDGTTGLFGGQRVPKSDPRVEACGTVDELSAALGLAAIGAPGDLPAQLRHAQEDLFVIGSHLSLAVDCGSVAGLPALGEELIGRLEGQIDAAEKRLPPLRQFILPGGSETAGRLHLARAICRRAERSVVIVGHAHPIHPLIGIYLNRLSDWLFVQARLANLQAGVDDIPWQKR